jgi:hypothetical protein
LYCGAFEEIHTLSREVLIRTKSFVLGLSYELVYTDTDAVFIKGQDATTGIRIIAQQIKI